MSRWPPIARSAPIGRTPSAARGPRTAAGKALVAANALRHGLAARQIVLRGEDPAEFDELRSALVAELAPASALEGLLVDRLAALFWRLRRVPRFEAALLAHIQNRQDADRGATRIKLGGVVLSCEPDASSPDGSQPPGTFREREIAARDRPRRRVGDGRWRSLEQARALREGAHAPGRARAQRIRQEPQSYRTCATLARPQARP